MQAHEAEDIARRIRQVFVRALSLNVAPDEASVPADLTSVAGLDSLAMLEFVAGLEQEFGCRIDPDRLTFGFLGDLKALVDYFAGSAGSRR